jgi:hypothetical protein
MGHYGQPQAKQWRGIEFYLGEVGERGGGEGGGRGIHTKRRGRRGQQESNLNLCKRNLTRVRSRDDFTKIQMQFVDRVRAV